MNLVQVMAAKAKRFKNKTVQKFKNYIRPNVDISIEGQTVEQKERYMDSTSEKPTPAHLKAAWADAFKLYKTNLTFQKIVDIYTDLVVFPDWRPIVASQEAQKVLDRFWLSDFNRWLDQGLYERFREQLIFGGILIPVSDPYGSGDSKPAEIGWKQLEDIDRVIPDEENPYLPDLLEFQETEASDKDEEKAKKIVRPRREAGYLLEGDYFYFRLNPAPGSLFPIPIFYPIHSKKSGSPSSWAEQLDLAMKDLLSSLRHSASTQYALYVKGYTDIERKILEAKHSGPPQPNRVLILDEGRQRFDRFSPATRGDLSAELNSVRNYMDISMGIPGLFGGSGRTQDKESAKEGKLPLIRKIERMRNAYLWQLTYMCRYVLDREALAQRLSSAPIKIGWQRAPNFLVSEEERAQTMVRGSQAIKTLIEAGLIDKSEGRETLKKLFPDLFDSKKIYITTSGITLNNELIKDRYIKDALNEKIYT